MKLQQQKWVRAVRAFGVGSLILILTVVAAWRVLSQSSAPVLKVAATGTNQFEVTVTNGVAGARYELWWTPALNDSFYPWQMIGLGDPGQTNLGVDVGLWPVGFFQVGVGTNYNGVWDYQLADPYDPSLGALSITIDSPTNRATLN